MRARSDRGRSGARAAADGARTRSRAPSDRRRCGSAKRCVDLYGFDAGTRSAHAARRRATSHSRSPASGATTRASRARSSMRRPRLHARLTGDTTRNRCRAVARRRARADDVGVETMRARLGRRAAPSSPQPGEIRAAVAAHLRPHVRRDLCARGAAVVIGLVGLSSSFGALVLARRREFGMLRHLGMTRRQIAAHARHRGAAGDRARRGSGWRSVRRSAWC